MKALTRYPDDYSKCRYCDENVERRALKHCWAKHADKMVNLTELFHDDYKNGLIKGKKDAE